MRLKFYQHSPLSRILGLKVGATSVAASLIEACQKMASLGEHFALLKNVNLTTKAALLTLGTLRVHYGYSHE